MQKCAAAFLLHITFCVLTCQIFSTEQLIAILIGTRNGGSFAVKGQGRKVIGKAAEIGSAAVLAAEDTGDAAVLPQPASRETDRASTVTIPRTFFIIRMENPLQKNRLILQLVFTNHKQILLEQAAFYKNQTDKIYPIGRIFRYCVGVMPRDWRNAEENLFGFS